MEFSVPLPQQLDKDCPLSQHWTRFYQRFQYHLSTALSDDPQKNTISILLFSAHSQMDSISALLKTYDMDLPKLQKVLEVVEQICLPYFILLYERYQFFTVEEVPGESMSETAMRLSRQSEMCEFGSMKDSILTNALLSCAQDKKFTEQAENMKSAEFNQIMQMWFGNENSSKNTSAGGSTSVTAQNKLPTVDLPQSILKSLTQGPERKSHMGRRQVNAAVTSAWNSDAITGSSVELILSRLSGTKSNDRDTKKSKRQETVGSSSKRQRKFKRKAPQQTSRRKSIPLRIPKDFDALENEKAESSKDDNFDAASGKGKRLKSLQCFECTKTFSGAKWMFNHFKTHHPTVDSFPCQHCDGTWTDLSDYVNHNVEEHFPELESKKSRSRKRKGRDGRKKSGRIFFCFLCEGKFTMETLLKQHIDSVHPNCKEYSCSHCGRVYDNFNQYIRHVKRIHTMTAKVMKCDLCQETFMQKRKLGRHLRKHLDLRQHQCDLCGKAYNERQLLLAHMRAHTAVKNHECKVCGKTFIAQSLLGKHMRSHTGEKPYTCELCGKSYGDKSAFQYHQLCHTGEQPYACEICGKRTRSVGEKNKHKRVHSERKPYVCEYCGKGFKFISNLIEHRKGHSGKRSHVCDVCGQTFIYRNGLTRHLQLRCPGRRDTAAKMGGSMPRSQQKPMLPPPMPPNPQGRQDQPMMPGPPPPPSQEDFLPWHSIITNYGMDGNSSVVLVPQF